MTVQSSLKARDIFKKENEKIKAKKKQAKVEKREERRSRTKNRVLDGDESEEPRNSKRKTAKEIFEESDSENETNFGDSFRTASVAAVIQPQGKIQDSTIDASNFASNLESKVQETPISN